jgi:multidrug efflux pump subunit AcrA (membrane-fusion protein)
MHKNKKHLFEPTLRLGETPEIVNRFFKILVWVFFIIPVFALFLPWQQNITALGKVTAFAPFERVQTIDAPIQGMIAQWHVQEASTVKAGDLLLEMRDIDPKFKTRIESQRDNLSSRLQAKKDELKSYQMQQKNLRIARDAKISAAQFRRDVAEQKIRAASEAMSSAQATLDTAQFQVKRLQRLLEDGLVSKRDAEVAERDYEVAKRNFGSAQAQHQSALAETKSASADIRQIQSDTQADLESTTAVINKIYAEVMDSENSLTSSEISLSRQDTQKVLAPRDGVVFRLPFNSSSQIVTQGQPLLVIQPSTNAPAVELMVDGRDAPLISKNSKVRLEFEGWPALQVPGWAKVRVGTFGGRVAFVDPVDNGTGNFRVMVIPDPEEQTWPQARFLRQGISTKGWVMLQNVSIGYELWRIFNGFPPRIPVDSEHAKGITQNKK